jgi:hypothetical protein
MDFMTNPIFYDEMEDIIGRPLPEFQSGSEGIKPLGEEAKELEMNELKIDVASESSGDEIFRRFLPEDSPEKPPTKKMLSDTSSEGEELPIRPGAETRKLEILRKKKPIAKKPKAVDEGKKEKTVSTSSSEDMDISPDDNPQ